MTAEVCSGRRRPNEINERSKLSAGKASSSAIHSPTVNPAIPQKTAQDRRQLDGAHIVVRLAVDRQRHGFRRALEIAIDDRKHRGHASGGEKVGVESVFGRVGLGRDHDRKEGQDAEGGGGAALAKVMYFVGACDWAIDHPEMDYRRKIRRTACLQEARTHRLVP